MPFCWSWSGSWKRVTNRTRKHWFWVLRHLLQTSTPDSGKFQAKPLSFSLSLSFWKKGIVFKCFLCMSWLLDSLDLPSRRKVTHKLMSRVDYGFNHCSVVSLLSRNFMSTYWWWSSVYLVILMYFMQINFHLLWSANKFTDFVVFLNFLLTLHATWIIKKSKILRIFKESK